MKHLAVAAVRHGLKENWRQFWILVMINAFVGGMIGLERSILPQIATEEFRIDANASILSFIIVFGISKAISNYFTGSLVERLGRKQVLVLGWIAGVPVPFILMLAPDWNWVLAANVLLGINQGLTWSTTVLMKIDLVGEKQRGFAMGLNEFAGYLALAVVAFLTGSIADEYGLRPYPFYLGIGIAAAGLLSSLFFVKETRFHAAKEGVKSVVPRLRNIFWESTWKNRNIGSVTQAGLINNLNDGMVWGLLPVLLVAKGFTLGEIGLVTALYPAVWGIGQVITGKMADHICKRTMLFAGMVTQGLALAGLVAATSLYHFIGVAVVLGWGTAMVYPTFLATIAEHTHPSDRPGSLGIFRFWRDLGYAIGALLTGITADLLGINASISMIAVLTIASGFVIYTRMTCRKEVDGDLRCRPPDLQPAS